MNDEKGKKKKEYSTLLSSYCTIQIQVCSCWEETHRAGGIV